MSPADGWSRGYSSLTCAMPATPVEIAEAYDRQGADELTFLDITASCDGRDTMVDVVRRTAERVFMPLTVGGASGWWRISAAC